MSVLEKKEYIEVTYNEKKVPRTDYPLHLTRYLKNTFLKNPGSILDIGCGRGEYLDTFSSLGFTAFGADISPMVNNLQKKFNVKQCDFEKEKLPYEDNSFDYIFSKSVIEHLRYPDLLLEECHRILKPGGKAIIMCPSWIHTYWGPFYIDHTHVTPFTLPSLEQALSISGFKKISADHMIQLPIVWKYPFFKIICNLISLLPLPYRPLYKTNMPETINKFIRFSNEKMLLAVATKD